MTYFHDIRKRVTVEIYEDAITESIDASKYETTDSTQAG
jgi:hypothetical protein